MGEITGNGQAVTGLGGARGFGETALPRNDAGAVAVDVSAVFEAGFTLGGVHFDADELFVSTDGLISFGAGVTGVAASLDALTAPFFAIFHADVDTRLDGEGAESGGIWLDVDAVADCVTITWDAVGFYRRNASLVNTFQLQLFDRGNGGFDLVFRYQDISWTAGDLQGGWGGLGGLAALLGSRVMGSGAASLMPASGDEAALLGLGEALGNTGVAGLWVWQHRAPSVIKGTEGADQLAGTAGEDVMQGLGGSDVLRGSAGADRIEGGSGQDRMDYGLAPQGLRLDLADGSRNTGDAAGDVFVQVESYAGSGHGDRMFGAAGNDWLLGAAGSDGIEGRDGNDRLEGGDGRDSLKGGAGQDSLTGGAGDDLAEGQGGRDTLAGEAGADSLAGGGGGDALDGGEGNDLLDGGGGGDMLAGGAGEGRDTLDGGKGSDLAQGGGGDDRMNGGKGQDSLSGEAGNDRLEGGGGNDRLEGATGADDLTGGGGDDWLDGGIGDDLLEGGGGADRFFHAGSGGQGSDLVRDFRHAEGDVLVFGLAGAMPGDFQVQVQALPDTGRADRAEVLITHVPSGRLVWTLVDAGGQEAILLQTDGGTFDLL